MLWHCWLGGRKDIRPVKNMGGWWRWVLVSPDGVAPSRMVGVSASVNLPLHHKVRSSLLAPADPGSPGKRAPKRLWWWWWQWTVENSVFGAVSLWFFLCVWNISRTAEWICTKFTQKTCLVTRQDEFEGQGHRSRSPGTKAMCFGPFGGLREVCV